MTFVKNTTEVPKTYGIISELELVQRWVRAYLLIECYMSLLEPLLVSCPGKHKRERLEIVSKFYN